VAGVIPFAPSTDKSGLHDRDYVRSWIARQVSIVGCGTTLMPWLHRAGQLLVTSVRKTKDAFDTGVSHFIEITLHVVRNADEIGEFKSIQTYFMINQRNVVVEPVIGQCF
jgi:hypothetical protein